MAASPLLWLSDTGRKKTIREEFSLNPKNPENENHFVLWIPGSLGSLSAIGRILPSRVSVGRVVGKVPKRRPLSATVIPLAVDPSVCYSNLWSLP